MKTSALQHGLNAGDHNDDKRQEIRDRALVTVSDPFVLRTRLTRDNGRMIIRELNDTIGMSAYEIVSYVILDGDWLDVEAIVPGRDLALMLKLKYGGL